MRRTLLSLPLTLFLFDILVEACLSLCGCGEPRGALPNNEQSPEVGTAAAPVARSADSGTQA